MLVFYGLLKISSWIGLAARARSGGYVVYEDGSGEVWVRSSESWGKWWRRMKGDQKKFEVEEVDEGTPKRGIFLWRGWKGRKAGVQDAERQPLLAQ